MKNSHFSEEILELTLSAVSLKRKRQAQLRTGAAALLVFACSLLFLHSKPERALVVAVTPEVPEVTQPGIVVFSTADSTNRIRIISTKDVDSSFEYINTEQLHQMLAGVSHGIYTAKDGRSRLWCPELDQSYDPR